jgi:Tfp pilus assembly protein PilF
MDCRKGLALVCLLGGLAGCVHHGPQFPPPNPFAGGPGTAQASKVDDHPAAGMKPSTHLAFAMLQCQTAMSDGKSPEERTAMLRAAAVEFRKAIEVDPKCVPAYVGLAKAQEEAGLRDQAAGTYREALAVAPKDPGLWYEQGMFQARCKEWSAALDSLRAAMAKAPENPTYVRSVGFCLARSGQPDDAVAWLTRCMTEPEAHFNVARILRVMNQDAPCREHLETALRLNPRYEEARLLLAEVSAGPGVRPASHTAPAPSGETPSRLQPVSPTVVNQPPKAIVQVGFEPIN